MVCSSKKKKHTKGAHIITGVRIYTSIRIYTQTRAFICAVYTYTHDTRLARMLCMGTGYPRSTHVTIVSLPSRWQIIASLQSGSCAPLCIDLPVCIHSAAEHNAPRGGGGDGGSVGNYRSRRNRKRPVGIHESPPLRSGCELIGGCGGLRVMSYTRSHSHTTALC